MKENERNPEEEIIKSGVKEKTKKKKLKEKNNR